MNRYFMGIRKTLVVGNLNSMFSTDEKADQSLNSQIDPTNSEPVVKSPTIAPSFRLMPIASQSSSKTESAPLKKSSNLFADLLKMKTDQLARANLSSGNQGYQANSVAKTATFNAALRWTGTNQTQSKAQSTADILRKPSITDIGVAKSIQDSFRNATQVQANNDHAYRSVRGVAQDFLQGGPGQRQGTGSSDAFGSSSAQTGGRWKPPPPIRNAQKSDNDDGSDAASLSTEVPVDKRYAQYQDRLQHQRSAFQNKINDVAPGRRGRAAAATDQMAYSDPNKVVTFSVDDLKQQMAAKMAAVSRHSWGSHPHNDGNSYSSAEDRRRMKDQRKKEKGRDGLAEQNSPLLKPLRQKGTVVKEIVIPTTGMTIRELASSLSVRIELLTSRLHEMGEEVNFGVSPTRGKGRAKAHRRAQVKGPLEDRTLDADVVELLALEMGLDVRRVDKSDSFDKFGDGQSAKGDRIKRLGLTSEGISAGESELDIQPRSPVVCVMGHVDHGKTTLLDTLRSTSVVTEEAGGITQRLSAFVAQAAGRRAVFLDTPGHAAFSAMREYGACATDIVILVVAIDDGVRPQTVEAANTAKKAGCSVIVALNKIDIIPEPEERAVARSRVLSQLADFDLVAEDFGGDVQVVEVAGKSGLVRVLPQY